MTDCPTPKPVLSATRLTMLSRCGMQYRWRYIENIVAPPGVAMLKGRAVHRAAEATLRQKMKTGDVLIDSDISDAARDAIRQELQQDFALTDDEHIDGVEATRARAEESVIAMARAYNVRIAPLLHPVHVERRWKVELPYSHDLEGIIDVQEQNAIRDLKTSSVEPASSEAETSLQLTVYALAFRVLEGRTPAAVGLDYIIDSFLAALPGIYRLSGTRGRGDFEALLARIDAACRLIDAGAFYPCDPSSWVCGKKWCGYWDRCPQGAKKKTTVQRPDGFTPVEIKGRPASETLIADRD